MKNMVLLGFKPKAQTHAILDDLFATVSLSAQHGNFQKPFLDLTRFYVRLDFPSGSNFLKGPLAWHLISTILKCQMRTQFVQYVPLPASLFSSRLLDLSASESTRVALDLKKKDWILNVNDPVMAIEYALQVLGSAKSVAWYSLKQREFMIELKIL